MKDVSQEAISDIQTGIRISWMRQEKAVIRKTVMHSEYINMINFSSSFDSKWGNYDIDNIDPAEWEMDDQEDGEKEN